MFEMTPRRLLVTGTVALALPLLYFVVTAAVDVATGSAGWGNALFYALAGTVFGLLMAFAWQHPFVGGWAAIIAGNVLAFMYLRASGSSSLLLAILILFFITFGGYFFIWSYRERQATSGDKGPEEV